MTCEQILSRAAELRPDDPEVAAHVATCAACRATIEDAREAAAILATFEKAGAAKEGLPPADAGAAWAAAHAARRRPVPRVLRIAARAAAVVLAAVGAVALAGGRVESSPGRVSFVLAPPWIDAPLAAAASQGAGPDERLVAAIARVHGDVAGRFDDVCRRLDERETALATRLDDALAALAARNDEDMRALVEELMAHRRELAAVRWHQLAVADADAGPPPLPAAR